MSGAKQNALPSAQDVNAKDGKRLITVSEEMEGITVGARTPADVYLEEESKHLSKRADQGKAATKRK